MGKKYRRLKKQNSKQWRELRSRKDRIVECSESTQSRSAVMSRSHYKMPSFSYLSPVDDTKSIEIKLTRKSSGTQTKGKAASKKESVDQTIKRLQQENRELKDHLERWVKYINNQAQKGHFMGFSVWDL